MRLAPGSGSLGAGLWRLYHPTLIARLPTLFPGLPPSNQLASLVVPQTGGRCAPPSRCDLLEPWVKCFLTELFLSHAPFSTGGEKVRERPGQGVQCSGYIITCQGVVRVMEGTQRRKQTASPRGKSPIFPFIPEEHFGRLAPGNPRCFDRHCRSMDVL